MLLRILILLVLLLTLPAWAIDRCELRWRWSGRARLLFALPHVCLLIALIYMAWGESYSAQADYWKGMLIGTALCLIVPETLAAPIFALAARLRRRHRQLSLWTSRVGWCVGGFFLLTMLFGFTLGYRQIQVKEFTYTSARLPKAFDGYRIVQISDLHLGTLRGREGVVENVVHEINACEPDLVVFTGDLVNYHADEVEPFRDILSGIRATDGIVSVMGNHDYAQYFHWPTSADSLADIRRLQQEQRNLGWHLLLNENLVLHRDQASIAIIGVENDGRPPFPARADLKRAQQGVDSTTFKVLLSHDPTHWRRAVLPQTNIDLTLSGHTHGMQFQMGGFSPAAWIYDEWGGPYYDGQRALYVNLGTGEVLIPFRLGAWAELTLITLRTEKNNNQE